MAFRKVPILGSSALRFETWLATNLNMVFYHDSLYKATWYFKRSPATDIEVMSTVIDQKFNDAFGNAQVNKFPEFTIRVWEGKRYRLQTFKEGNFEYSIEFRDLRLSKQVELAQHE